MQPASMRWLLPSVGDLFFVALFCLLIFTNLSSRLLGDAGIGWHIRTGQLILSTHSIPQVDPFSSSLPGHAWFAWEWLFDLFVGWLDAAAGLNGVVVLAALVIALTFSLAFRWLVSHGTNILVALILVLLAACSSMIHFFARPHIFSWLLTVLWFWILDSSESSDSAVNTALSGAPEAKVDSKLIWLLPVTMLLWVSLHGGFLIGFVLLAIYWIGAAWRWLKPAQSSFDDTLSKLRVGQHLKTLTLVGVLSSAATFANPYGPNLHIHIYRYLSNHFLMDHIDEFQSPNFHLIAQECFAGLLLLTLLALAASARRARRIGVSQGLIILFAVYSGLYASRNIPVSSLLLILVVAPALSGFAGQVADSQGQAPSRITKYAQFFRRMHSIELNLRGHAWPTVVLMLSGWILIHGGNLGPTKLIDARFDAKRFPVAGVDFINNRNIAGPIFTPDSWGGYVIYRLYPRSKVVIDDRHDFYGEAFLRSYLKTIHLEPGWQDFLEQYPARVLIVPKGSALANILIETKDWRSVYRDDVAVIFVPSTGDNK
jgi:hypothetical protein